MGVFRRPCAVALIALTVGLLLAGTAIIAQAPALHVPSAAEASPTFDPERATEAYLALVPPEQRARSDAYFEGSNWLQLWSSLYTVLILGLILAFGWSSRMRDLARRMTNRRPLQTLIYWVLFVLYVSVVSFPLTVYSGFYREHQYGLATQTFWPWLNEQLIGLGVLLVLGGLGMIMLYAVLRRVGPRGVPGVWRYDSARLHRPRLQQLYAARRFTRARTDSPDGARQRDRRRYGLRG